MAAPSAELGLFLEGLRCGGCVRRVEQALGALPGVAEASVQLTTQRALVRFDPSRTDAGRLVAEGTVTVEGERTVRRHGAPSAGVLVNPSPDRCPDREGGLRSPAKRDT